MQEPEFSDITVKRKCLFISDAHLGGFSDQMNHQIEQELISLIDFAEHEHMEIFILGDLFDYWMEIRGRKPDIGSKLLSRIKEYHCYHDLKILFITGNHDNWTENYLTDSIGFELEHEYRIEDFEGKRTLLMHGDGLKSPKLNFPRLAFHRFLRNPYFVLFYKRILPAGFAIMMMKYFSRLSRNTGSDSSESSIRLNSWVRNQLEAANFDAIVCGHTHHPVCKTINGNTSLNLGNFYRDRTVGLFADGNFYLTRWDSANNQLVT